MDKKIGLFWLRDDFRTAKNNGLIEATRNHEQVVVFYLYKKLNYNNQEAQKWWLSKSLFNFQKKLKNFNIILEIIKTDSFKTFFDKLLKILPLPQPMSKILEFLLSCTCLVIKVLKE